MFIAEIVDTATKKVLKRGNFKTEQEAQAQLKAHFPLAIGTHASIFFVQIRGNAKGLPIKIYSVK